MFIVFWIYLFIFLRTIQSNQISNCSFLSSIYRTNSAVSNQIEFLNQTSIRLFAHHAFLSSVSSLEFGLIYQYSQSNYLVPFPLLLSCTNTIYSCQLTTMTTRDFEPIHVQLTALNFTRFNHTMGLYLKQGRYQLSNCSINNNNNQQDFTDLKTIFYIDIQYEKPVGSPCDSFDDRCGSSSVTTCSSSTCTCLSNSSSLVAYSDSYFCADMLNTSNCQVFPSRCIAWCNQTTNYLCICPNNTLKIQRNNQFICELPINSNSCSINDSLRQCSIGQCCIDQQCLDCSLTTTTIQTKTAKFYSVALDENLQWILSLLAGILGISVIILLGLVCWFNRRRNQSKTEQSISNTSTSSLYIAPQQQKFPSHPLANHSYRTESFRHAVLSGHKSNRILEHVSTRCDSEIDERNRGSSPTFSTLEYIVPTQETNIYQIILPPPPQSLTHTV